MQECLSRWRDKRLECVRVLLETALRYAFGNAKCEDNRPLSVQAAIKPPLALRAMLERQGHAPHDEDGIDGLSIEMP